MTHAGASSSSASSNELEIAAAVMQVRALVHSPRRQHAVLHGALLRAKRGGAGLERGAAARRRVQRCGV